MTTDSEERIRALLEILESEQGAGDTIPDGADLPEISVDLRTLLGQMTALKNEVRKETLEVQETRSRLSAALEEVGRHLSGISALERHLGAAAVDDAVRAERTKRIDQLIDMLDRQEAAIQAARKLAEAKRFFFRTVKNPAAAALVEGLELTGRHLESVLRTLGIERIETVGHPFDAARMEALEITTDGVVGEGYVVEEIRPGFVSPEGVYRFAQVTVRGE